MPEELEAQAGKSAGIDLKQLLILKVAGILGAVILLILQTVITGETVSIEKHADSLVAIEQQISKEISEIHELVEKHK